MAQHILPVLGNLPVQMVDTAAVVRALEPIWASKSETASKLRSRIEAVLDQARVLGHRDGENPARWRGHLDKLLAAPTKLRAVEHRAAMAYSSIPEFMAQLRTRTNIDARALEFAILTAARSAEVLGARWGEIDGATWTIPGQRMKGGKEHRVQLSSAALKIVKAAKSDGDLYFPVGDQSGKRSTESLSEWGLMLVHTVSGPLSATGPPSKPPSRTTSSSKHWRTALAKSKPPTGEAICSNSAGS